MAAAKPVSFLQKCKNNPLTTITTVVTLLFTLIGGGYKAYVAIDGQLDKYLTRTHFDEAVTQIKRDFDIKLESMKLEDQQVRILELEDEIAALDFKIADGSATRFDIVQKEKLVRRLDGLRNQ